MTQTKLSSYAKMKLKYEAKIHQLQSDIITLVEDKDYTKTQIVKQEWQTRLDIDKAMWLGDVNTLKPI